MIIKTASGKEFNLDFEPILTLAANPDNYTEFIIDQINNGYYYLPKCNIVIDAGANVGLFSIYASTMAQKVYAIEPTPEHYNNLCAIIKHLEITNIVPIQAALWEKTGNVNLCLYKDGNTARNKVSPHGKITVVSLTVEDLFNILKIDKVDYFKCDIEGGEHFINFTPVASKIAALFIEVHDNGPGWWQSTNNVYKKLQKLWKNSFLLSEDSIFFCS